MRIRHEHMQRPEVRVIKVRLPLSRFWAVCRTTTPLPFSWPLPCCVRSSISESVVLGRLLWGIFSGSDWSCCFCFFRFSMSSGGRTTWQQTNRFHLDKSFSLVVCTLTCLQFAEARHYVENWTKQQQQSPSSPHSLCRFPWNHSRKLYIALKRWDETLGFVSAILKWLEWTTVQYAFVCTMTRNVTPLNLHEEALCPIS